MKTNRRQNIFNHNQFNALDEIEAPVGNPTKRVLPTKMPHIIFGQELINPPDTLAKISKWVATAHFKVIQFSIDIRVVGEKDKIVR